MLRREPRAALKSRWWFGLDTVLHLMVFRRKKIVQVAVKQKFASIENLSGELRCLIPNMGK